MPWDSHKQAASQAAGSLTPAGAACVTLWLQPGWTGALYGQLLAFQAAQGRVSLLSKVPNGDYTGLVIH